MTGRELATVCGRSRPEIKVLYVSGYTADIIGREGVLEADVAYLPKPFTPAQLAIKVREVLGQSKTAGRILVLDDDGAVRGLLQQALLDAGYEVMSAGDGREGMRLVADRSFRSGAHRPDHAGPGRNRNHSRPAPRLSGHPDCGHVRGDGPSLPEAAELLGAHVTLCKPIDCQDLLRTIRELLTEGCYNSKRSKVGNRCSTMSLRFIGLAPGMPGLSPESPRVARYQYPAPAPFRQSHDSGTCYRHSASLHSRQRV